MLKDSYAILGVSEYATEREISEAYFALRKKYQEERFAEGDKGNEAAKKLTEVDNAYEEITSYRKNFGINGETASLYKDVDSAIRDGNLQKAQELLDSFDSRTAEWHYLQAVVFYKKNWATDCKKQLEIALNLDPDNEKYKTAYDKLVKKIDEKKNSRNSGATQGDDWRHSHTTEGNYSGAGNNDFYDDRQMGGDSCFEFCCRMAICNLCLNCLCNCR